MTQLPKHDEIRLPMLQLLQKSGTIARRDFEQLLAEHFKLDEDAIALEHETGRGNRIFKGRCGWAVSYLNMAGLVLKPKRGIYQISDKGLEQLKSPSTLNTFIAKAIEQRRAMQEKSTPTLDSSSDLTPQEDLYSAAETIRQSIYSDIIDTILSKSPRSFEALVISLLQKMGYGGEIKAAGQVTQYTNDGGIDGIIKEDVLGLGRIHIQAKRHAIGNTIGREEIQKFVGALAVAQSNKGVFITTSTYTSGALEYANSLNGTTNVVLIDGEKLAEYIYDYGLGMQVEQTIEIKKLDSDFWDSMEDAK